MTTMVIVVDDSDGDDYNDDDNDIAGDEFSDNIGQYMYHRQSKNVAIAPKRLSPVCGFNAYFSDYNN